MSHSQGLLPALFLPTQRPIVQAQAPERNRVQFTIGQQTHEKLRRLQALLRREIPNGDPGAIDRALTVLLEEVENISLRCRRHNQYEAELIFGPRGVSIVREGPAPAAWNRDSDGSARECTPGRSVTCRQPSTSEVARLPKASGVGSF